MNFAPAIFPPEAAELLKAEFFKDTPTGFFVDVGANQPQHQSESWSLEQRGWTGVLVEPLPDLAEALRRERRAKVYAVACSSPAHAGTTMPLRAAGVHSTLNPDFYVAGAQPALRGTIQVPIRTLDDILADARAPTPVDFVSIDVESHEIEVLEGFDLAHWRPRLIVIEDHVTNRRLHRYLRARGYTWMRRTGLNAWYVPRETPVALGAFGRFQFIRKYYLGVPFRNLRDAKRKLLRQ